jgi:hypothetical protein
LPSISQIMKPGIHVPSMLQKGPRCNHTIVCAKQQRRIHHLIVPLPLATNYNRYCPYKGPLDMLLENILWGAFSNILRNGRYLVVAILAQARRVSAKYIKSTAMDWDRIREQRDSEWIAHAKKILKDAEDAVAAAREEAEDLWQMAVAKDQNAAAVEADFWWQAAIWGENRAKAAEDHNRELQKMWADHMIASPAEPHPAVVDPAVVDKIRKLLDEKALVDPTVVGNIIASHAEPHPAVVVPAVEDKIRMILDKKPSRSRSRYRHRR